MNKLEQPLYPKLSSIYNKILQLVSAILLIVILMVFLVDNTDKNSDIVEQHFEQVSDKFLQQAVAGVSAILNNNDDDGISKKQRNIQLQSYLNNLTNADYIKHVHLYDNTGLLMLKSGASGELSDTIKLIYGIDEVISSLNKSKKYIPVIKEIRNKDLKGYLRLIIEKSYLTTGLSKNNDESDTRFRLLLLVAGFVGFLLTRGLNRFSRQGYRAPNTH